jgi:oxygen-independent coproporphyrinogen-3 oxidase
MDTGKDIMNPTDTDRIQVTRDLLVRYDRPGPRYTSYPTAPEWQDSFTAADYRGALADAATRPDEALSVYVHIPFCHERCIYCGCNVVVTEKEGVADRYLDYLDREMALAADALGGKRPVMQLHWGGGTPTYLDCTQIERLTSIIRSHFTIGPGAEMALEIDPRVTTREQIFKLRELGFNRVSMGVQDLNPEVQRAITRFQTEDETRDVYAWCREAGFGGINFDLVYGLPFQRPESWSNTVRAICEMRPDRLAVYSYAHVPWIRPHQKWIPHEALPLGPEKYELFATARHMLLEAGYEAIGMDHFALPEDELAVALSERRLHRNFMGYSVVPAAEMISFGTSAIGEIGGCYAQNQVKLSKYYEALDAGEFPTARGFALTRDDEIRRWLIRRLMCDFHLDTGELERRFGIAYDEYFAAEEEALAEFRAEGFVARNGSGIEVRPLGRVFIRNVAMVFDAYLKRPEGHRMFSRTV